MSCMRPPAAEGFSRAPSPGRRRRRGASASALELTLRALRPLLADPGGHGAVHQPATGDFYRDARGLAPRGAAVRGFRLVPAVREAGRQRHAPARRRVLAAAVGGAALGRARADRTAARDDARLRRDRHPPPGRARSGRSRSSRTAVRSRQLRAPSDDRTRPRRSCCGCTRARHTRRSCVWRCARARTSWSRARRARARRPGPRR